MINAIIHEQNTKEIMAVNESLNVINTRHIDFQKTFASFFSAYTTSILRIVLANRVSFFIQIER